MLIKVDGINSNEYLCLGVQTSPEWVTRAMHDMCHKWKPSRAKSYTIFDYRDTDYFHNSASLVTGYADFKVKYFTTLKEGMFKVK